MDGVCRTRQGMGIASLGHNMQLAVPFLRLHVPWGCFRSHVLFFKYVNDMSGPGHHFSIPVREELTLAEEVVLVRSAGLMTNGALFCWSEWLASPLSLPEMLTW